MRGKNTDKYITFSVPIKKELDNGKTIIYKLKFIDSFRFISASLSKLAHDLLEIYSKRCRDKNCKSKCEFKGLEKNNLPYLNFSVLIKNKLDNGKTIIYRLKFIDRLRFISISLSKIFDNLLEIYSKKCTDRNCKSESEFKGFKNNKLPYNCKECRKKN